MAPTNATAGCKLEGDVSLLRDKTNKIPDIAPIIYSNGLPKWAEAISTFLIVTFCQLNQLAKHKIMNDMTNTSGVMKRWDSHQLNVLSTS